MFLLKSCNSFIHLHLSAGIQNKTWFRTYLSLLFDLIQDSPVPLVDSVQDSPVPLGLVQLVSELQQLFVGGELCPLRLVQFFTEVFDLRGVGRVSPQQLLLVKQDLLIELRLQTGQLLLRLRSPSGCSQTLLRLRPEP